MESPYRETPDEPLPVKEVHICERCEHYQGFQGSAKGGFYRCRYSTGEIDLLNGRKLTKTRDARKHRNKVGNVCSSDLPWIVPWDVPWESPWDVPWDIPRASLTAANSRKLVQMRKKINSTTPKVPHIWHVNKAILP